MLFNSVAFAIFLPVMLIIYWSLRGAARRWTLLIGSYIFYSWCDWRFSGLLLLSTLIDFVCASAIDRRTDPVARKRILAVSVVSSLGILCTFKYFNFFRDSAKAVFSGLGLDIALPTLDVALPAGISFYTFQTMSYVIDVYRGERAERRFRDFALFVACFPQLVAGPIVRSGDFLPQLDRDRRFAEVDWSGGVYRMFRGLFKKMVVADTLSIYVDAVFASPGDYPGFSAWIALYAYAFQVYMDFSGYSDVAIGAGHLMGFKFAENFDRPYLAVSRSDFWRRWHITLSTWLRDYLYIPLGGSQRGKAWTYFNLFFVMVVSGLWHGPAWTFVVWGVYQGVLLVLEKLIYGNRLPDPANMPMGERTLRVMLHFHIACFGLLIFRSPDWATVGAMVQAITNFSSGDVHGLRVLLIVVLCAVAHLGPLWKNFAERVTRWPGWSQGALAAACMWTLVLLSPHAKPFIYFQF